MTGAGPIEIFATAPPGLEPLLAAEVAELGLGDGAPTVVAGGVAFSGDWRAVWRANRLLRGAGQVLARLARFRASHLSELDKRARRLPWETWLRPDVPVSVAATCKRSRIYHSGAAAVRVAGAIEGSVGAPVLAGAEEAAEVRVLVRIERDLCSISVDTSGAPLHKRGFKQWVGKAPLRETQAALALRAFGFNGREPVLDPFCGSGTLVLEAADWAAGQAPGRARSFAFQRLAAYDAEADAQAEAGEAPPEPPTAPLALGFDRDAGAVEGARANGERAGLADWTAFHQAPLGALTRPPGPPGLVVANPPYGARIGESGPLAALYATLGARLQADFAGWRLGLITGTPALAKAVGLPLTPAAPPTPHGSLKILFYRSDII